MAKNGKVSEGCFDSCSNLQALHRLSRWHENGKSRYAGDESVNACSANVGRGMVDLSGGICNIWGFHAMYLSLIESLSANVGHGEADILVWRDLHCLIF
jgi:hypothetical protein